MGWLDVFGDIAKSPFGGGYAGRAGRGLLGDITGSSAANDAIQGGLGRAADANLTGMRESLAAQQRMYDQSRNDLAPFRELDLGARRKAMGIVDGMDPNSAYFRQRWGDVTRDINAVAGKGRGGIGFGGGGWQRAIARARVDLESDYEGRRLGALQGLYGNTGPQQAQMAQQHGQALGSAYQAGYGQLGSIYGQQGQAAGQAEMAPFQNALGAAGVAASAYGGRPPAVPVPGR